MEKEIDDKQKMMEDPETTYIPSNPLLQKAALAKKMANVIAKSGNVEKKGRNTDQKYNYATHADIIAELRKIISDEGIYILPKPGTYQSSEVVSKFGSKGRNVLLKMNFEIVDTETGYSITVDWYGEGQDYGDKAFYKSYTGALKYFLLDTFMIATNDDPEKESHTEDNKINNNQSRPQQSYSQKPIQQAPKPQPIERIDVQEIKEIEKHMSEKGKTVEEINTWIIKKFPKSNYKSYKNLAKSDLIHLMTALKKLPDLQPEIESSEIEIDPEEVDKGIQQMQNKEKDKI